MDPNIGKFLDNRYELLEVIGAGGMAVVYKARCHRLNRLVAVKILKADLAQDAEFRRRFHDESQAVAMLSHPNIVAVYDVSHSDDLDYIVMELIDGITLKQYMQKKGPSLNWREALHFITQIMRALSHAHSRGIIHRDIKPHNLMVLRDGSVKVSDFGIARITSAHQSTLTQEALGSVHYISPEQARGSHIDARSDIYSAGVVLYEMITGRLPFEGETPVAVAIQHINSIPLSPRELDPELPEALEAITMKAMAPDPDERYLNADEMLADLEEFRKNPNINFDYTTEDLRSGDEPTRPVPVPPATELSARARRARVEDEELDEDYDDYDEDKGPLWPILLAVGAIAVFIIVIIAFLVSMLFPKGGEDTEPSATPSVAVEESLPPEGTGKYAPPVENLSYSDAWVEFRKTGLDLTIEKTEIFDDEITAGNVVRTDPEEGEELQDGQSVMIFVSKGPKVEKKDLTPYHGLSLELVRKDLEEMGFKVKVTEEPSDTIAAGKVIRHVGESEMEVGSEVELVVSTGPDAQSSPSPAAGGYPSGLPVESAPPSAAPSATPTPTPTPAPAVNSKPIFVRLPESAQEKTSVKVRIDVAGETVHSDTYDTFVFPISPLVRGQGTQQVSVYVDDVLVQQYDESFS